MGGHILIFISYDPLGWDGVEGNVKKGQRRKKRRTGIYKLMITAEPTKR